MFVSRDYEGLPKFVLVGRGRVATTSPRQDLSAGRHARGVSQLRICSATEKRIGLPLGLVPVLVKQCPLDSVAPKPEVVVANVAFRDKRLSGGQRSLSFFPNIRRQGDETMDERTPEAGPGLVGDLAAPASQRQGLAPATAGQCNFRALGEDQGFVPSRLQCARLFQRLGLELAGFGVATRRQAETERLSGEHLCGAVADPACNFEPFAHTAEASSMAHV